MCGIAGMIDLAGGREVPQHAVRQMGRAIFHRGPDEEGFFWRPGIGMVSRRLSIVDLADGQQPMSNEDRTVHVVFNGELFDHLEKRKVLESRGHHLHTHCDTEIIPHLWEDHQEGMFERLRGQFAIAVWDESRRQLTLGRDRFGITPLYWTRQGDWLLFASEIKGLLASGMVDPRPDHAGIDHIFTFAALPGPTTCFEGVQLLPPANFLQVRPAHAGASCSIREHAYWTMDFPDRGEEEDGETRALVDQFEQLMLLAVEERLRADVPVGSYLSGGVDSSIILALATHLRGKKADISTYTVRVDQPELDELDAARLVARHIGAKDPIVQEFRHEDTLETYPRLIAAVEAPVIDTSCAALLKLAQRVHECGQKVVLTGEGADEWLIGYPWYKLARLLHSLDLIPGLPLSDRLRRLYLDINKIPHFSRAYRDVVEEAVGGPNAWVDGYGLLSITKLRFYGEAMQKYRESPQAWTSLGMDVSRAKRWHPLNRGVWMAARVNLAGHLLQGKGDRIAMHSSVEVRYPFLDEDVFDFTAKLHPRWKLRGLRDKHILRVLAERWLPESVYRRKKVIFRAPLDSFHLDPEPAFIGQLLSPPSLKRTGYFDVSEVHRWREDHRKMREGSVLRLSLEMGLAAVVATQLWHHLYIDSSLCELPGWSAYTSAPERG
jgi:asparagine synthase (glutamine-hydrolysing)